jgi:hypothetical protein
MTGTVKIDRGVKQTRQRSSQPTLFSAFAALPHFHDMSVRETGY